MFKRTDMIQRLVRDARGIAPQRWALLFGGFVGISLGAVMMIRAQVGLGPWDVLHQGISRQTGISIGMASILIAAPLMLGWLPLRERPGIGTLLNIVMIGLLIDLFMRFLPVATWLPVQLLQMAVGVVVLGTGAGLYLSAGMGAGPRDGLMMGLVRRTGRSVRLIRTLMELTVLVVGWFMGGTVGIGTVAFALGIGPVIQTTFQVLGTQPSPVRRVPDEASVENAPLFTDKTI